MDETAALETAHAAIALALAAGATDAEATVSIARRFDVEAREGAVAKLDQSVAKGLRVRVFQGRRRATLASSDFSQPGLREAVARAVEQAAFVADDDLAGLPDAFAGDVPDLDLHDARVAAREGAEKIEDALAMERLIRQADPRVTNSGGSHYGDAIAVTAIANTRGFAASYTATRAGRSTSPVADDGGVKRTAHYGTAARRIADLESVEAVAATAASRAVSLFGARKPPTMRAAVIFERDVAASVLDDVFSAVSAANVAVGNSWLIGRIGERIGSDLVTVVDDGRLAGRLGSAPFDGEGVATRRTPVFERGRLRTFLYDTYYARKLGAATTGNASGAGVRPNSFYLEPGAEPLEALIRSTRHGVLVLDTIGFATEHASGTYSRGARGFLIEGGEVAAPIDEFTIAGDYAAMLAGVDGVANDLRFDASVVAPSFRVAEMTISGM